MQKFKHVSVLASSLSRLRQALVDDLPGLARAMPNVERIEPSTATWDDGCLERRDRWLGRGAGPLLRLLPTPSWSWTVRSSWQLDPFVIRWSLEAAERPLPLWGSGRVKLNAVPGRGVRVVVAGAIDVEHARLSPLLPAPVARQVERALAALIERNVRQLFAEAEQLLSRHATGIGGEAATVRLSHGRGAS